MGRIIYLLAFISSSSFAHIKPFPHNHIGFLHAEDIFIITSLIALSGVAFLLIKRGKEL